MGTNPAHLYAQGFCTHGCDCPFETGASLSRCDANQALFFMLVEGVDLALEGCLFVSKDSVDNFGP
jgi:hypothetical protein